MQNICYQINLSENLGGAEVYTHFFTQALISLGQPTTIFVNKKARFWESLGGLGAPQKATFIPVNSDREIIEWLPEIKSFFVLHSPISAELLTEVAGKHILALFAHHAFASKSVPAYYRQCNLVLSVSEHMTRMLKDNGLKNCYPDPFYGVASIARESKIGGNITVGPLYKWDKRKVRDRVLSHLYPLLQKISPPPIFTKRPGLTLGIVSRISPIKQFPLLFSNIAPILKKYPQINIEIFGSGEGYAQVRDLKRNLKIIAKQVRFWGEQVDVASIYPRLDYLLAGLPEREALGLNVIEAQFCGTPVLAVDAPPFTETVINNKTGFLYKDPRTDNGQSFEVLLNTILNLREPLKPLEATDHLAKFSIEQFNQRVERLMAHVHRTYLAIW